MSSHLFELFDEYAAAYARGERPSAEDYLDRAGTERAQLAALLEDFLRRAPIQPPNEDDLRYLGLLLAEEPPLLALRVQQSMRVDDVVGALVERLGLDQAKQAKVKRYYQQLEGGLLAPARLSKRLRAALTAVLGAGAEQALSWTAPPVSPAAAAPAFMRLAEPLATPPATPAPASAVEDEIDRLFTGGE
jgi:AcrR family transcriptional regulator